MTYAAPEFCQDRKGADELIFNQDLRRPRLKVRQAQGELPLDKVQAVRNISS